MSRFRAASRDCQDPRWRENWKIKISMAMCVCISAALSQVVSCSEVIVSGITDIGEIPCRIIGALLHYSWMTCFIVMTYIALDILLIFNNFCTSWYTEVQNSKKIYISWLVSAVYVGCCVTVDLFADVDFNYGSDQGLCFIQPAFYFLVLFVIPVFALVGFNFFCFIISIISIYCSMSNTSTTSQKEKILIFWKISSLVGVTWILGILPQFFGIKELWYPFLIANSLQGVFVFFAFGVSRKVRVAIFNIVTQSTDR